MKRKYDWRNIVYYNKEVEIEMNIMVEEPYYPKTLIRLSIGDDIKHFTAPLPKTLKKLHIDNFSMLGIVLHKKLINISFDYYFNKPVRLPNKLIKLKFDHCYDQPVILPKLLKHITFGKMFSQKVVLPNKLKVLIVGYNFNQTNILPKYLTEITFECVLKKKVRVPETVVKIYINQCSRWFIENLPNNLRYVNFSSSFTSCPKMLPNKIETLEFDKKWFEYYSLIKMYPNVLKIIVYNKNVYTKH